MAKIKDESVTKQTTWPTTEQMMLEQMKVMQAQINKLSEEKKNPHADEKKIYDWPHKYSFKLYAWVPVLSYKSVKENPHMDWNYRNQAWHFISNQLLELTLASKDENGQNEVKRVEVNEFNKNHTSSEKMVTDENVVIGNPKNPSGYQFTYGEFWTFIVSSNIIN